MKLQSVLVVLALTLTSGLLGSMITSSVSAQYTQPAQSTQQDLQATVPPSLPSNVPSGLQPSLPQLPTNLPAGLPMLSSIIMPPMPGRYQLTTTHMNNNIDTVIILCDTATGQCWNGQVGTSNWNDMGTPVKNVGGTVFTDGGVQGSVILGNTFTPPALPKP